MSHHFSILSSSMRRTEHGTPIADVKTKRITLDDLAKIDAQGKPNVVLKFDELERDTVHMLTEYRVLRGGASWFMCIGVLESGEEFWMPKSLYNEVKVEDPPHAFVCKSREECQYKPYITKVYLGSVLRTNGLL